MYQDCEAVSHCTAVKNREAGEAVGRGESRPVREKKATTAAGTPKPDVSVKDN